MKIFFLILSLVFVLYAQYPSDWSGYGDTLGIYNTLDSATYRYTNVIIDNLHKYRSLFIVTLADDTTQAGFASDSINFEYGFQVGTLVADTNTSNGVAIRTRIDTLWDFTRVTIDTMVVDSFGSSGCTGYIDPEGDIVKNNCGAVDTSSVTGYAAMYNSFPSPTGELLRMWAIGLNGAQMTSDSIVIRFSAQGIRK